LEDVMNKLLEWLWRLLPSRCEICRGKRGVRGNEQLIEGKRMCDYCHAAMLALRSWNE